MKTSCLLRVGNVGGRGGSRDLLDLTGTKRGKTGALLLRLSVFAK